MSVAAAFVLGMSIGQAQAADLTEPVPGSSGWTFTGAAYLTP